jgi:hypothetical protein
MFKSLSSRAMNELRMRCLDSVETRRSNLNMVKMADRGGSDGWIDGQEEGGGKRRTRYYLCVFLLLNIRSIRRDDAEMCFILFHIEDHVEGWRGKWVGNSENRGRLNKVHIDLALVGTPFHFQCTT